MINRLRAILVASCLFSATGLHAQSDRASALTAAYRHAVAHVIPGSGPVVLNLHVTRQKADVVLSPTEKADIAKSIATTAFCKVRCEVDRQVSIDIVSLDRESAEFTLLVRLKTKSQRQPESAALYRYKLKKSGSTWAVTSATLSAVT
jgi:hypothetical protein